MRSIDPISISTPYWHELTSELSILSNNITYFPLPTWQFGISFLPSWQSLRSSSDLFSSSSLRVLPAYSSPMWTTSCSSLSLLAFFNHRFNSLRYLLVNNSLTGHLAFLLRGHSYTQCALASCCIRSARSSILDLISVSYLSILALLSYY